LTSFAVTFDAADVVAVCLGCMFWLLAGWPPQPASTAAAREKTMIFLT
jgi:hypothetical protein